MIEQRTIDSGQVHETVRKGEFPESVLNSADIVVVIMSQDWCPQWTDMKSWIYDVVTEHNVYVYEIIYNKEDYYREFLSLKEGTWKNGQIPYLRYYRAGKLYHESNHVRREAFSELINAAG